MRHKFHQEFRKEHTAIADVTHQRHFICTQRRAVAIVAVGLFGEPKPIIVLQHSKLGLSGRFSLHVPQHLPLLDRDHQRFNDMPAVGTKTGSRIFSEPASTWPSIEIPLSSQIAIRLPTSAFLQDHRPRGRSLPSDSHTQK